LKSKSGKEVATAFEIIFKHGRKPEQLRTNSGHEFYYKDVITLGFEMRKTENKEKICLIERLNRTMKERMFKFLIANNTYIYIDILQDLVNQYNNTKHSSIKMTLVAASKKVNESRVRLYLYGINDEQPSEP
jgi:hypothetical protein